MEDPRTLSNYCSYYLCPHRYVAIQNPQRRKHRLQATQPQMLQTSAAAGRTSVATYPNGFYYLRCGRKRWFCLVASRGCNASIQAYTHMTSSSRRSHDGSVRAANFVFAYFFGANDVSVSLANDRYYGYVHKYLLENDKNEFRTGPPRGARQSLQLQHTAARHRVLLRGSQRERQQRRECTLANVAGRIWRTSFRSNLGSFGECAYPRWQYKSSHPICAASRYK